MSIRYTFCVLLLAAVSSVHTAARADAGHDHGGEAAARTSIPALPRFAASSELFELVGVLDGKRLTLYLDHAPDNSPVKSARLELDVGGQKVDVKPHGDGEFEATLGAAPKPGIVPLSATIIVGNDSDLLGGELDLQAHADAVQRRGWREYVAWIGGGIAGLAALVWLLRFAWRARSARRRLA